ncbi:MAG: ABC transporter ATP-binding protein, partial [Bacteroidota bacterium]
PTNDLDIFTLSLLEDYLQDFPGVLLVVTHDRYFMDKLVEHVFVFEEGNVKDIGGNYTTYRQQLAEDQRRKQQSSTQSAKAPKEVQKKKFGFNEQYEFKQLSTEIEELEKRKSELNMALENIGSDHEKMTSITRELGEVMTSLDEKELRWLELSELAED